MEKKRPDLIELRQQRELIRRITVAALVAALAVILVSCQALTSRLSYESQAASPTDQRRGRS